MNENIKNLWDAALEEFSKQHQFATIMLPEPLKEKFAELIVKETLQVARAGIAYGDGMEDAVYKYFGVEE